MRSECIIFFQVLFKVFFKLFGWSYLSLTYGCSVHFTYAALPSRVSQKEIFLLEFYFKFISILHRVNN